MLWSVAEQTINVHAASIVAKTWFGDRIDGRLGHLIDQYIFYSGVWEPDITRFFRAWLRPGDAVADVGANVGYYSLLASRLVGPTGRVVAIEPWPPTIARLNANISANGIANITVRSVAVAERAGEVILHEGPAGNVGATGLTPSVVGAQTAVVQAEPLANTLRTIDLSRLSLIKIDIEGGEVAALRNILDLTADLAPRIAIVVEITPAEFDKAGWPIPTMLADFAQSGFTAFMISNDYDLTPDWLQFEPDRLPRLTEIDGVPIDRFDAVFARGSNAGCPVMIYN